MKKVYFAGSIRGGRDDAGLYKSIIDYIASLDGFEVLTEHIGLKTLKAMGEAGRTDQWIYHRDMDWLRACDAVIAEVTTASLGVGYEIAKAEEWDKPVLTLFQNADGKKLSAMIAGSPKLENVIYTNLAEAQSAIHNFLHTI